MSVVIRGMKMPRSCDECELNYDCFRCILPIEDSLLTGKDTENGRLPNCPLVEIPAQHGRLIDADALRQSLKESIDECHKWADEVEGGEMYARVSQSLGTFVECSLRVKAAPTIIEAEEGEG